MRKHLLILISLMLLCCGFANVQNTCDTQCNTQDSIRYLRAYEYIVQNDTILKGEKIKYSGKLFHSQYIWFENELRQSEEEYHKLLLKPDESDYDLTLQAFPNMKDNALEDATIRWKLNRMDLQEDETESFAPLFLNQSFYYDNEKRLYFSAIKSNELFAEIQIGGTSPFCYYVLYLILFNSDDSIKKVFRTELNGL